MENTTRSTAVVVDHVSTKTLHPLYAHFDGQTSPQDAYVELDLEGGNMYADYSGEVGNGIPERIWNGRATRFDIDPHLTASEINDLLDEIAPIAQEWIDARQGDELDSDTISYVIDAGFKIQQLCKRRVTESGGMRKLGSKLMGTTRPCMSKTRDTGSTCGTTQQTMSLARSQKSCARSLWMTWMTAPSRW